MQTTPKNGDNTPADALSRRLAAFRFTVETKPAPRLPAAAPMAPVAAALRAARGARSIAVHPGTMSWHEMHSPHPEESAACLASLLGDEVASADHGGGGCYSTILCDGLQVAGATALGFGREPGWSTYVRVPSVDLVCHIALSKGGSVRVEPSGILGLDRRAVIADPTGAALTIIAGGDDRRTTGAGAIGWDELRSTDPMESVRFWCSVFKWSAVPLADARETQGALFLNGGLPVASVQRAQPAERASRWLPVATVRRDLFDGALQRAIHAGARIVAAPQPHGVLGRLAILVEPTSVGPSGETSGQATGQTTGIELALGGEPRTAFVAA